MTQEEREAQEAFAEIDRQLQNFYRENPDLYIYLRDLLQTWNERLERLEALARQQGKTVGPIRKKSDVEMVQQDALEEWYAREGKEALERIGGMLVPKIASPKIRAAVKEGLLSPEDAARLITRRVAFSTPRAGQLPEKKDD